MPFQAKPSVDHHHPVGLTVPFAREDRAGRESRSRCRSLRQGTAVVLAMSASRSASAAARSRCRDRPAHRPEADRRSRQTADAGADEGGCRAGTCSAIAPASLEIEIAQLRDLVVQRLASASLQPVLTSASPFRLAPGAPLSAIRARPPSDPIDPRCHRSFCDSSFELQAFADDPARTADRMRLPARGRHQCLAMVCAAWLIATCAIETSLLRVGMRPSLGLEFAFGGGSPLLHGRLCGR